jgi:predicted ABC-type ATPase
LLDAESRTLTDAAKEIFILGGPNGAGRTTAAGVLLPRFIPARVFLKADETARELVQTIPSPQP